MELDDGKKPALARAHAWRSFSFGTFGLTMVALATLLGARALYFAPLELPPWLDRALGSLMRGSVMGFRVLMRTLPLQVAAVSGLLLAFLVRPRLFWTLDGARRGFRPWVYAVVGSFAVANHQLFDADPFVASVCCTSFVLLALGMLGSVESSSSRFCRRAATAGAGAVIGLAFGLSPSRAVTVAVLFWGLWLAFATFASTRYLRPSAILLMGLVAAPVASFLIPTSLVLLVPALRRGSVTRLEERGYAYGYCEVPSLHKLFLTVPVGQTGDMERLKLGYVAEYDSRDLSRLREHRLFDDDFYGGLRMAFCLGERVQVTMNGARIGQTFSLGNALEFDARDPSRRLVSVFDETTRRAQGLDLPGHDAVYDRLNDAVFYVSEWTDVVFRLDRRTGEIDKRVGDVLPPKRFQPFVTYGLQTNPEAVHASRRTIYLGEWLGEARIFELHLDTLELVRVLQTDDTGAFDLSVDEEEDRLFASGLWGINVIDLATGQIEARRRTGPGARAAVVDRERDLVYVPTTFGGHLWVFDRKSLAPLGRVATGLGGRPAYLSQDGQSLFASDGRATYRWDAAELGRRFGRRR